MPRNIQGYAVIWGSPTQRDAYSNFFDRSLPPTLNLRLPVKLCFDHNYALGTIGEANYLWPDQIGICYSAAIYERRTKLYDQIIDQIDRHLLYTSSAATTGTIDKDGRIVDWRLRELSLTPRPAEKRMRPVVFT